MSSFFLFLLILKEAEEIDFGKGHLWQILFYTAINKFTFTIASLHVI